jgi:proteic killer suppression protein
MIKSFKHKGLKNFFETGSLAGIQAKHAKKLQTQLTTLNKAEDIAEMDFPNWRLHALKGDLAGYWSLTVNGNWRVTFRFEEGHAYIVDYQDYH